jgi:hypothetical protein
VNLVYPVNRIPLPGHANPDVTPLQTAIYGALLLFDRTAVVMERLAERFFRQRRPARTFAGGTVGRPKYGLGDHGLRMLM